MFFLVVLLLSSCFSYSFENKTQENATNVEWENRIVGGFPCPKGHYPFMVLLLKEEPPVMQQRGGWSRLCGGSLLASRYVLTAAHCIVPNQMKVMARINFRYKDPLESLVIRKVMHPQYDGEVFRNDIAVLELGTPLSTSSQIEYVRIPTSAYKTKSFEKECQRGYAMGWGSMSDRKDNEDLPDLNKPQCIELPIISLSKCREMYGVGRVFKENMCTLSIMGKDVCGSDSGGPLLCGSVHSVQVGIVSWGIGCADPNHPGVYTRVDQYLNFIHKNTKYLLKSVPNGDIGLAGVLNTRLSIVFIILYILFVIK